MSNWTIWPKELNYEGWPFFQRNIQYRARLNCRPFQFCSALRHFLEKFLMSPKGPPSIFLIFCNKWMLKICNGPVSARLFDPTFGFSGTVKEKTWHYGVFVLFLSLRYDADLVFRSGCFRFWRRDIWRRSDTSWSTWWMSHSWPDGSNTSS